MAADPATTGLPEIRRSRLPPAAAPGRSPGIEIIRHAGTADHQGPAHENARLAGTS
jgi:hypothetical protein